MHFVDISVYKRLPSSTKSNVFAVVVVNLDYISQGDAEARSGPVPSGPVGRAQ